MQPIALTDDGVLIIDAKTDILSSDDISKFFTYNYSDIILYSGPTAHDHEIPSGETIIIIIDEGAFYVNFMATYTNSYSEGVATANIQDIIITFWAIGDEELSMLGTNPITIQLYPNTIQQFYQIKSTAIQYDIARSV
jgi:hypothetical protein